MTVLSLTTMVDAADPKVTMDQRLEAIHRLVQSIGGRPVPFPRWVALKHRIAQALADRAASEGKTQDAVLACEIEAAVTLAAPAASAAAARAFTAEYIRELRARTADEFLESLLGDWRHDFEELGDERPDLNVDPEKAADAERLVERLPEIADLTEREAEALLDSVSNANLEPADRLAASRARKKIRATVPSENFFS